LIWITPYFLFISSQNILTQVLLCHYHLHFEI
jgi:hypothetical protein